MYERYLKRGRDRQRHRGKLMKVGIAYTTAEVFSQLYLFSRSVYPYLSFISTAELVISNRWLVFCRFRNRQFLFEHNVGVVPQLNFRKNNLGQLIFKSLCVCWMVYSKILLFLSVIRTLFLKSFFIITIITLSFFFPRFVFKIESKNFLPNEC